MNQSYTIYKPFDNMWLIKYDSEPKDGEVPHEILRWIKPLEVHSIGRDEAATYTMKNPKISKHHLQLQILQSEEPSELSKLEVSVIGRQTMIGQEFINRRTPSAEEQSKPIVRTLNSSTTVILGKSGKKFEFIRHSMICNVAGCLSLDLDLLKKLDISYSSQFLKYTTHVICSDVRVSTTTLMGLLKEIPIISPSFIDTIDADRLSLDFATNFPKVEDHLPDPKTKIRHGRSSLFKDILFVLGDSNQTKRLGSVLEAGGGKILTLDISEGISKQDVINLINDSIVDKNLVFVSMVLHDSDILRSVADPTTIEYHTSKMINEISKELGKYQVSMEDIFHAVEDYNVEPILRQRLSKSSISNSDDQPPLKKQKLGRGKKPQIKALDSLDFFAGGGKFESSQAEPSTQIPETPQDLEQIAEEDEQQKGPPKKKEQRSRIQSLPNQMLNTNFRQSINPIPETIADRDISLIPIKSDTGQKPEVQTKKGISETNKNTELDHENPEEPVVKAEKQTSFHNAVINAKKSANERINTQLGLNEIVTPDAIKQLKDLAIVEVTDIPMRKAKASKSSISSTNPQWAGRKNFKTFVKNTKDKGRAIRDQSFLYTRQFVPLRSIDPRNVNNKDDSFTNDFAAEQPDVEDDDLNPAESFAFRNELRQPTVADKESIRGSKLFVEVSDDSEIDDGLDMSVRRIEVERVPEFRRHVEEEPQEVAKQNTAIEKHVPILVDESDDDDDTPKFRFRS